MYYDDLNNDGMNSADGINNADEINTDGINADKINPNVTGTDAVNADEINETGMNREETYTEGTGYAGTGRVEMITDHAEEPDVNCPQNQNYPYGSQYQNGAQSGQYYAGYSQTQTAYSQAQSDYGQTQTGYSQTQSNSAGSGQAQTGYSQMNNTSGNYSTGSTGNSGSRGRTGRRSGKGSLVKRGALLCAAALLFGVIAGATMFGVNRAANTLFPVSSNTEAVIHESQISEQQTTPAVTVPAVGDSGSTAVLADVSAVVEEAMPSVVAITNTMYVTTSRGNGWFSFGGEQTYEVPSSGSGIIVGENDSELLIVTNNHVVEDADQLTVTFIDGTDVDATIKGTDEETDLAVIAVPLDDIPSETKSQITIAVLGDSDSLKLGQGVIAIGNALGRGQSVTVGYVSALNREITVDGNTKEVIQTDAAINPGNSGGALLNTNGEVIGINEAKYAGSEVEGVGYAIPVSDVKEVIADLMNRTTKVAVAEDERGYLGVRLSSVDSTASQMYGMPEGAYIYQILDDGPAADSDLREMDIVTKCNGDKVKDASDLTELISYYRSGDNVTLTVERLENGEYVEKTVDITLGKRPADFN